MRLSESGYELLALIASRGGRMRAAEIPGRLQNELDICRGKPLLVRVARCGTLNSPLVAYLTTQGRAELARHAECGEQRLPDVVEALRLQGEHSPQPAQVSTPEPMPHRPLVGERTGRRTPMPELARDENRERQSRYCQGFDPDWWLPALSAAKWRTSYYPREESPASVQQWLELIDQMRIEYLGPFGMPEREAELRADRENDLGLIREDAPQLHDAVMSRARSPADSLHLQDVATQMPSQSAGRLLEAPDTIEEPPGIGEQADSKADKKPKKTHPVPVNPDILKLAKKIKKDREKGMSLIDSAREFCEGNERRAKSLLRQVRRYPGLWK